MAIDESLPVTMPADAATFHYLAEGQRDWNIVDALDKQYGLNAEEAAALITEAREKIAKMGGETKVKFEEIHCRAMAAGEYSAATRALDMVQQLGEPAKAVPATDPPKLTALRLIRA